MTESRLPAVVQNPPVVPQLITLQGPGWDGMQAWAFPSPRSGPQNNPNIVTQTGGFQLVTTNAALSWQGSARTYRALSLTPWVRAAIKIRRDQIASAQWDIVKADPEGKDNKRLAKRIANQLDTPNARNISAHSFLQEVVEDLLVLDGAAIEKVRYPGTDEIAELWPTPAEYIAIDEKWDGSDPERSRYYYVPDNTIRARFKNEDMIYMMDNPRTISALGISPIQVLLTVIDSELQAMEYNRRMVMGAPPNGALNIGDSAISEDVERARAYFQSNVFGQSAMAIIGGFKSPSFMPFGYNNRDMQFREWQDLLLRCIAVVYGLSPMDLGITFDVNRSSATAQQENTEDRGLRPLLDCVQRYLTREYVWDESFGGREANLKFVFTSLNLNETEQKANINRVAMPGVGWKTVNEARIMDGREPVGATDDPDNIFNHILMVTPTGMLDLNTGEVVGAAQLAQLAADAKTAAAAAQGNADTAKNVETKNSLDDLALAIGKSVPDYSNLLAGQSDVMRGLVDAANRPITIDVHPSPIEVHSSAVEVHPPTVEVHSPIEVHPAAITVTPPNLTIEPGAVQVTMSMPEAKELPAPNVQVDVHVPELKAGDVIVNTPAEIAITKMPKRGTKRVVTKRNATGGINEVLDVEADLE